MKPPPRRGSAGTSPFVAAQSSMSFNHRSALASAILKARRRFFGELRWEKKHPVVSPPKKLWLPAPPLRFFALNKKTFFEFYHQIFKKIRMFSVENISCWKSLEVRFKDHFSSGTTSSLSLKKWDCVEWNTFDGLILWKNWCLGDEVFPFGACFPG